MGDLVKLALFFAVLWGFDKWDSMDKAGHDFTACQTQALEVLVTEKLPPSALLLAPNLNQHDQIDELIQRCMLAKGYDYLSEAWARCPTEKLSICYEKPSFATEAYRFLKEQISKVH